MSESRSVSCSCEGNNDNFDKGKTAMTRECSPPSINTTQPCVIIEFCNRCRWLHRATWTLTELMLTFPPPDLVSVTLVPLEASDTAGRFRIWLLMEDKQFLMWDRKLEGGFPELKVLKQRIRDHIEPGRNLGHSDKTKAI